MFVCQILMLAEYLTLISAFDAPLYRIRQSTRNKNVEYSLFAYLALEKNQSGFIDNLRLT